MLNAHCKIPHVNTMLIGHIHHGKKDASKLCSRPLFRRNSHRQYLYRGHGNGAPVAKESRHLIGPHTTGLLQKGSTSTREAKDPVERVQSFPKHPERTRVERMVKTRREEKLESRCIDCGLRAKLTDQQCSCSVAEHAPCLESCISYHQFEGVEE